MGIKCNFNDSVCSYFEHLNPITFTFKTKLCHLGKKRATDQRTEFKGRCSSKFNYFPLNLEFILFFRNQCQKKEFANNLGHQMQIDLWVVISNLRHNYNNKYPITWSKVIQAEKVWIILNVPLLTNYVHKKM